jgi:phosphate-selective porin OprO/OprP
MIALLATGSANAQSAGVSAEQLERLQAQIKALEREVQALKGKMSTAEKARAAAPPAPAYAAAPPTTKAAVVAPGAIAKMSEGNRPTICTADNLNCIGLTSRVHFDVGGYAYRPNSALTVPQNLDNGVNARRARIGVVGTFMGDWNYALIYEFGGSSDGLPPISGAPISGIENAYLSYTGFKPFVIEGGYMDAPYTLDEATSSNDIMFMERSSSAIIATNIAAGDFRSVFGIRGNDDRFWAGAYITGPLSGTTHIFAPTPTATGSPGTLGSPGFSEQLGAVGRATYQVLQDKSYSLHIGADVELLIKPPGNNTLTLSDRPELRIDPTALVTTGAIANISAAQVYSAELAGGYGPLFFQGEYFSYNIDRSLGLPSLHFDGWYAQGSWTVTGESRKYIPTTGAYSGIVPDHPFSWSAGGIGAWEIAARYSHVNLNDLFTPGVPASVTNGVAGGTQNIYTVGLNWYVNRNIRFMFNYLHGVIDRSGSVAPVVGADIGARFDALAMRTQIAF